MLDSDVMSNHSNPRMYWQPMSLDTEALLASVSAAHLYTMPGTRSVHTALDLDQGLKHQSARARPSRNGYAPSQSRDALAFLAVGVIAGGGQPLITTTKFFDVTRESGSSTRSQ